MPTRGEIKTSDSFEDAVELLSDNIFLIIIEKEQKKKESSNQSLSIFNLAELLYMHCFKTLRSHNHEGVYDLLGHLGFLV